MLKQLVTLVLLSAFLATPALAQRPKAQRQPQQQSRPARKAQRNLKRTDAQQARKFQRALNLNESQMTRLNSLLAERNQAMEQLRTNRTKQRKQDAQAVQDRFQTGLRAVLTPEQEQLFDSRLNGRKQK